MDDKCTKLELRTAPCRRLPKIAFARQAQTKRDIKEKRGRSKHKWRQREEMSSSQTGSFEQKCEILTAIDLFVSANTLLR